MNQYKTYYTLLVLFLIMIFILINITLETVNVYRIFWR
jgi:hypothetical protein